MNILILYAGFCFVTFIFLFFIFRMCFLLFIKKEDPKNIIKIDWVDFVIKNQKEINHKNNIKGLG